MIKLEVCEEGCHDQGKTEFPLEVAPEHVGTVLRGQGGYKSHSNPVSKRVGRGKEAEGERAGREESKVKFSSSSLL